MSEASCGLQSEAFPHLLVCMYVTRVQGLMMVPELSEQTWRRRSEVDPHSNARVDGLCLFDLRDSFRARRTLVSHSIHTIPRSLH